MSEVDFRETLETAMQELQRWAADHQAIVSARDPLIRRAHEAGLTKHRIHVLTGIARTTIDSILIKGEDEATP